MDCRSLNFCIFFLHYACTESAFIVSCCCFNCFAEACWNLTAERTEGCWSPAWTKPAGQNQEGRWTFEGTTGVGVVIACCWLSHLCCLPSIRRTKQNVGLPKSATKGNCCTQCSSCRWMTNTHPTMVAPSWPGVRYSV